MNALTPPATTAGPNRVRFRPATDRTPTIAPARSRTVDELLDLLAGAGENPSDGERDIVASAIRSALEVCTTNEFPSLAATLEGAQGEIAHRARRCENSDLELQGFLQKAPFLALCAEVHRSGFVDSDGKEARSKLFLALADLATYQQELLRTGSFGSLAAGLRLLIARLAKSPRAGAATQRFSIWELLDWIESHPDLADYVKQATKALRPRWILAWRAPAPYDGRSSAEGEGEEEATPEQSTPDEIIWSVPEATKYEYDLPADLEKTLLANELTRITALSRYASGSLLNRSDAWMRSEVSRLLEEFDRSPADAPHLLAQLLSIPTGTPVADVYRIQCRTPDVDDPAPAYPGVLSEDGRWLICAEYDPRTEGERTFDVRAVYKPVPEPLAARLRAQPGGLHSGMPAISTLSGAVLSPAPRDEAAWFTTLASRLVREGRFGISIAQHALHSSLGLDEAVLFYDRIPTSHIAHVMAQATHPWFGCAPRPSAIGMPSHHVGSQRVPDKADCKPFLQGLRAGWSNELTLPERIHLRSRNLRYGLLLGTAHRTNYSISEITLASIAGDVGLITLGDKAVALDYPTRLAVLGSKLVRELENLLAELSLAIEVSPGSALAQAAARILDGSHSLFLHVDSVDACHAVDFDQHVAEFPPWALGLTNWTRQLANDELGPLAPEPLRVAQGGWHATRAGAISELSVLSPLEVCSRLSHVVDAMLANCGWAPLPPSGLPAAAGRLSPVHWMAAVRTHQRNFEAGLARLERAAEAEREAFASSVLPGVNAFFRANGVPLEATVGGLVPRGGSAPVPVGRDLHAAIVRVMVADTKGSVLAREVLHGWLQSARKRKAVTGPLPRRIVRTRPSRPGPFPEAAHRSLEHRNTLLAAAHGVDLSAPASTFLTVLLEGWVADADVVLQLMQPRARLHDLYDGEVLLIEASRAREPDTAVGAAGCLAFDGPAAMALRSWHRGGEASVLDAQVLRNEIHAALAPALASAVGAETVFEELEALMRVNLSLRVPGIVRDVASRRIVPVLAPLDRIKALHEGEPICPQEPDAMPAISVAAGVRKSRAHRAHEGYNRVKDTLGHFASRWTPSNDDETRAEAVASLRVLVPGGVPSTGVHILALYAAAYLAEGLQRARVRPVTVQDAVYSVGEALMQALPEQADLSRYELWRATYARALSLCPEKDRPRLAKDLTHFQKVMAREFDLPIVSLAPFLLALDSPSPPEPLGFLTAAEQSALVCFGRIREADAIAGGLPADQEEAVRSLAVITCGLSTSMRDREIRVPQIKAWSRSPDDRANLALRSNGNDFVKSEAGRRALFLTGEFSDLAEETIDRLARLKQARGEQGLDKLLLASSRDVEDPNARNPTRQINADLRYITANPQAAFDIMRKTWAVRSFGAIGTEHVSLWPARDFLSEIGQAEVAMTLGHYLHDPVTFLARMPRGQKPKSAVAGWILGMVPKATARLLHQDRSWFRPEAAAQPPVRANFTALPSPPKFSTFHPTVDAAAALLEFLAEGQCVEAALRALGWPAQMAPRIRGALEDIGNQGVAIGPQGAEGTERLSPPARRHGHDALDRCRTDAHCWHALAWIFRVWLADWRKRKHKGFTARAADWALHVPASSPLHGLPWQPKPDGHMTFYGLPGNHAHGHSAWAEVRWLALAAWLVARLRE